MGITAAVETLHGDVTTGNQERMSIISPKSGSLGAIIRSYKAALKIWCQGQGIHHCSRS